MHPIRPKSTHAFALILGALLFAAGVGTGTARDTLYAADGRTVEAEVTEVTGAHIVIRAADGRTATMDRDEIVMATFGLRPEMDAAEQAEGLERVDALRRLWYLLRPSIELPESPAGEWGLKFATALLASEVEENRELAFEVFQTIEDRDWNRIRRHEAGRGRFNALLRLDRMDEAMAEAERLAADPENADPALLILARLMLGDLARASLAALEEEHPRWQLDDDVRPRRQDLLDEALDHYFFPHLYHGDRPADAARGLASAIELFLQAGLPEAAAARAEDLVRLYPDTPEADEVASLVAAEADDVPGSELPGNFREADAAESEPTAHGDGTGNGSRNPENPEVESAGNEDGEDANEEESRKQN